MATRQSTVDALLASCAGAGRVAAKKMFGEYCIYLDDKPVALVCDDQFYVKITAAGRELAAGAHEASPYLGAKPHLVVPPELWADGPAIAELLRVTFEGVPQPRPRRPAR